MPTTCPAEPRSPPPLLLPLLPSEACSPSEGPATAHGDPPAAGRRDASCRYWQCGRQQPPPSARSKGQGKAEKYPAGRNMAAVGGRGTTRHGAATARPNRPQHGEAGMGEAGGAAAEGRLPRAHPSGRARRGDLRHRALGVFESFMLRDFSERLSLPACGGSSSLPQVFWNSLR